MASGTAIAQLVDDNTDLGYWLDSPGSALLARHHQLWVWLRPHPTERHYDPESVACRVLLPYGSLERIVIRHPWTRGDSFRLLVGGINLNDRKQRLVHFYAFGGELTITRQVNATLCRFSSEAPMLAPDAQNPLTGILIDEVEAELAGSRAAWDVQHRPGDFESRLAQVSPRLLYCVCLRTVVAHLRLRRSDSAAPTHRLIQFAEQELASFAHTEGADGHATLTELLLAEKFS